MNFVSFQNLLSNVAYVQSVFQLILIVINRLKTGLNFYSEKHFLAGNNLHRTCTCSRENKGAGACNLKIRKEHKDKDELPW